MKKNLPLIIVFFLIVISALHRGGISFQAHLLWTITLLPIWAGVFIGRKHKLEPKIPTLLLGISMLFLLSIIGGWIMSSMQDFGFVTMTTLISGVITMLLFAQAEIEKSSILKLFTAMSVVASGLCIFGIVVYITTPADRLASTFAQLPYIVTAYPNALALFLIGLIPYTLLQFSKAFGDEENGYRTKEKMVWFIINTLIFTTLLLTFSRGGIAIAGLIMIFFLVKKILKIKKPFIILVALILLATSVIQYARPSKFATNEFSKKITLQSGEKTSSIDERISFWKGGVRLIQDRPIWGFGPDTFEFAFPHYQEQPLANSEHPHNMFIKHAVDFGIPSTILYIFLLGLVVFMGIRSKEEKELIMILLLSIGGIIAHNLIDYNLNFVSSAALLWLELGLIVNISMKHKVISSTLITPRRVIISLTTLVSLIVFLAGGYEIYQRIKIINGRTLAAEEKHEEAAKMFANTHPLFFDDAILLEGNNAIETKNYNLAHKLFITITNRDMLYAEAFNTWTELLMKNNKYDVAEKTNYRALTLDRFNHLRYHLNLLKIMQKNGSEVSDSMAKGYIAMLESYLNLLRNNAHNTVETSDPSSAIKIAYILETAAKSPIQKVKFQNIRKKLIISAQEEREKFFNMFSIPLSPL